jgi:hypothetical protein
MPVDQTGETVVFVLDGQNVEAHIRIDYKGSPKRFAWLIPVPEVPEVEVGAQAFFDRLSAATVPTFVVTPNRQACGGSDDSGGGFGCASNLSSGGAASSLFAPDAGATSAYDPDDPVASRDTVGAFDVTILRAEDATEVQRWLTDNGFLDDPSAAPLIEDYIQRKHVFVAVKLTPGNGVDQIHPLVLRYPGNEPCVPLKLTSIAAVDDMSIRLFLLGNARSVPLNYRHVELNPFAFDWPGLGRNYDEVLSAAVDSKGADGQAFVTEYAGRSNIVRGKIASQSWRSRDFRGVEPQWVPTVLETQGLLGCSQFGSNTTCLAAHPMVVPLLRRYLPAPKGVDEDSFYFRTFDFQELIDLEAWDEEAFLADYEELIVAPARHADDLLERWPYLTRLATTISPEEMTVDPIFLEAPSGVLPDVKPRWRATRTYACSGPDSMRVDGHTFQLEGGQMPFGSMPASRRVTMFTPNGDEGKVSDNDDDIDDALRPVGVRNDDDGCSIPKRHRPSPVALGLAFALVLGVGRRYARRRPLARQTQTR